MEDSYSDDENAKLQTDEVNEYDLPIAKKAAPLDPAQQQKRIEAGEAFDRDTIGELLGDTTDLSVRQPPVVAAGRQYGDSFTSLGGVLSAARASKVTLETVEGKRVFGNPVHAARDFSVTIDTGESVEGGAGSSSSASAAFVAATGITGGSSTAHDRLAGSEVAVVHLPHGLMLATAVLSHIKEQQSRLGQPSAKRSRTARKGAAQHAPVGLAGL